MSSSDDGCGWPFHEIERFVRRVDPAPAISTYRVITVDAAIFFPLPCTCSITLPPASAFSYDGRDTFRKERGREDTERSLSLFLSIMENSH